MAGLMGRIGSLFGKGGDASDAEQLRERERADKKARERAVEQLLANQHCSGCGRHCPLLAPHCTTGMELRDKRIAQAGLKNLRAPNR